MSEASAQPGAGDSPQANSLTRIRTENEKGLISAYMHGTFTGK
ncbi:MULTISPECIES: hypothetical protein [Streptomyces]|jgi:hypothetical protein|nr:MULTISPECIES: hypothetical protein [Streptomyces]WUB36590.1 hypothetical protein OHN38_17375 [Streptomyces sp. NBC_00588]